MDEIAGLRLADSNMHEKINVTGMDGKTRTKYMSRDVTLKNKPKMI